MITYRALLRSISNENKDLITIPPKTNEISLILDTQACTRYCIGKGQADT